MENLRCYDTFLKLFIREENMETTINNFIFIFHPNKQINKHFPSVFFSFGKSLYNFMK